MCRQVKYIGILALVLIAGSCAKLGGPAGSERLLASFPEMESKQKLQIETSSQPSLLRATRSIGKGSLAEFVLPAAISYSDRGDLYISDNNGQTIHRWPSDSNKAQVFLAQNAVGRVNFPNAIQYVHNEIFVADNDGIKVFSAEGQFERLIRTYLATFSFIVTEKNTILLNALVRNADSQDPLIVELDSDGRRIRGFGLRKNTPNHNGVEDQAFLATAKDLLFVAFKYRKSVEVYEVDSGKLIRTFEIDHPVFSHLAQDIDGSGPDATRRAEGISSPRYVAGVKAIRDRILLCLHLPLPEILELDQNGRRLGYFRVLASSPAIDIFGFDARDTGNNVTISIGLVDPTWSSTIYEVNTALK